MKIWHISDTHGHHRQLIVPGGIDMVIHSGDCSNYKDVRNNYREVYDFMEWYSLIPVKHKIFVGGNHDTSIANTGRNSCPFTPQQIINKGITYLFNSDVTIDGVKIWGSPYTPTYGTDWAWNLARHKMHDLWQTIPDDTDIVVTHGPPNGVLDISTGPDEFWLGSTTFPDVPASTIHFCGCKSLLKRIFTVNPKAHLFGHIHNIDSIQNAGMFYAANRRTLFSNGSCVTVRRIDAGLTSNGNIIDV